MKKLTANEYFYLRIAINTRIAQLEASVAEYDAIPNGTMVSNLLHFSANSNREELVHQKALLGRFTL